MSASRRESTANEQNVPGLPSPTSGVLSVVRDSTAQPSNVPSSFPGSAGDHSMGITLSSTSGDENPSYLSRVSALRSRILRLDANPLDIAEPPTNQRRAIWHPQSGLFVSPNATYVPRMEEDSGGKPNWSVPRMLSDDEIYRAFRPRIVRNSGELFGRLNLTNAGISQAIGSGPRGFILDPAIANSWIRLENALLDLADSLLPKSGIPVINYPKFPYEYGYRDCHYSKDMTIRCAIRSRDAFVELSCLVSFIISLNMDVDGSYEKAFYKLRTHRSNPVHSAWLDQLKLSQVCDFSENFRVGIVVNPYTCHWARCLYQFTLAHVPVWIFWGHQFKNTAVAYKPMEYFLPPDAIVDKAIDRSKKSGDLILPSYHFDLAAPPPTQERDAFAVDTGYPEIDQTHSYVGQPPVSSGSPRSPMNIPQLDAQPAWAAVGVTSESLVPDSSHSVANNEKALAALDKFFAHRQEILDQRIANEEPVERQRRLGREASAKSRATFARKSTVFEWVDTGNGVYERVQLQSKQADFNWSNFTKNQRRFTSYNNQWDLCPQLPKYSDEFPDDNDPNYIDYDDGCSDDDSFIPMNPKKALSLAVPQDGHTTSTLQDLQSTLEDSRIAVDDEDEPLLSVPDNISLESFLLDHFGFDLTLPIKWPLPMGNRRGGTEPSLQSNTPSTGQEKAARVEDTSPASSSARRDELMLSSSRQDDWNRRSDSPSHRTPPSTQRTSGKSKGSKARPSPLVLSRPDKGKGKVQEDSNSQGAVLSLSKSLMSLSLHVVELDVRAEAGIVNLVNTLTNAKGTFADLPANFDHSPACPLPLSLTSETLELRIIKTCIPPVYLLRHVGGSLLTDPWMITTQDASTVLLVFRRKWSTVSLIARELTRRGARFNTVKAVTSRPTPSPLQTAPLGIRLKGYTPGQEDYEEYLRRRNYLLCGPKGRAALMHGGIIARIARDISDPGSVLDGPLFGDTVICKYDDLFLVDDKLTPMEKNIICGVYYAQTEQSPEGEKLVDGATRELSWWPQDSLWNSMGCYLRTEWTPLAEAYYERRSNILLSSNLTIFGVTEWRQTLRKANALTRKIEAGVEHYQGEYLTHCYHEMLLANRTRIQP